METYQRDKRHSVKHQQSVDLWNTSMKCITDRLFKSEFQTDQSYG